MIERRGGVEAILLVVVVILLILTIQLEGVTFVKVQRCDIRVAMNTSMK